jgi:tetratricopeptide (TPR) repeat protein
MNLGAYYVGQGDMASARDVLQRATGLQNRNTKLTSLIWYNLGNAEERLGNTEDAIRSFGQALALDPDNVFGRAGLGRLERSRGRSAESASVLEEGLRRLRASGRPHPYETLLHRQLGLTYHALGRTDAAVRELEASRETARNPELRAQAEQDLKTVSSGRPAVSQP